MSTTGDGDDEQAKRAALRARWAALADSIGEDSSFDDDDDEPTREFDDLIEPLDEALPLPPPIEIQPRRKPSGTNPDFTPLPPIAPWRPGTTSELRDDDDIAPPQREPTLILNEAAPIPSLVSSPIPSLVSSPGTSPTPSLISSNPAQSSSPGTSRLDSVVSSPLPSLVSSSAATTPIPSLVSPGMSPTIGGTSSSASTAPGTSPHVSTTTAPGTMPAVGRAPTPIIQTNEAAGLDRADVDDLDESASRPRWSEPVLLAELIDRTRDSSRELLAHVTGGGVAADDIGDLDELDDDIISGAPASTPLPHVLRRDRLQALEDLVEPEVPAEPPPAPPSRPSKPDIDDRPGGGGRDFARQLRAKMTMMAQRLFQGDSPAQPAEHRPRHDHHTEIDLAALAEEPALEASVTEIARLDRGAPPEITTSPGSWDTQVRERGLPDSGEIVRGVSDAASILARMFAQSFTGRVAFRKDDYEKVVYFDQGRPVFASSNEPGDRMGELLVREGKITASQYERCQVHVEQSGRRMGEILVDFGYLKRRELLPAVRRHVEDIIYSLFGWDRGHYHVTAEPNASSERIRLSRHPASLILEGIRRKLDRTALEKSVGPASTVVEVPDRERLGGIINTGDLAAEERAALAAFDGQADLAQVARSTGLDLADVLPLAWGLVVLGLATARRAETDAIEESTALVGETDLAIDRERVRARWQLVTEADYFALLGVRRDATAFEIRRAYQAARRDFAADCFPADLRRELARELEDIASVLDEAFRVLRDDRLRQTYLANLIE